jgi:hypothetical protein
VPWHNNNAGHAIKHFAKHRMLTNGRVRANGLQLYLVLLSLYQTCVYKEVNFLRFLLSGEQDMDAFAVASRRRQAAVRALRSDGPPEARGVAAAKPVAADPDSTGSATAGPTPPSRQRADVARDGCLGCPARRLRVSELPNGRVGCKPGIAGEGGVGAQGVVAVRVRVAGEDAVGAGADHLHEGVLGEAGVAGVVQGRGEGLGKPDVLIELADGEQAGVAGEPARRRLDHERRTEKVKDLRPGGW